MNSHYLNIESPMNEVRSIINQKSADELSKLMSNDDEAIKLISNLSEIQHMETIKESLKENIKRLALKNLDKEPILIQEKEQLTLIHDQMTKAKQEYKLVREQYEEQLGETNQEMIWVLLQTAASELEQSTEETAVNFFNGVKTEDEVTEFERRFIEDRKHAHELKVKAEKFHELMQMSQSTSYLTTDPYMHASGYR